MRSAVAVAILVLVPAVLAGCGSAGEGTSSTAGEPPHGSAPAGASAHACVLDAGTATGIRVAHVSCGQAQRVAIAWAKAAACRPPAGASRAGCGVGSYRCVATATGRGWSVSCSRPGRAIAFTAKD